MFIFLIRLLFSVDTSNLIIGDSHERRLGERFQFSDTDIFGVGGMTTGQLRHDQMERMRKYSRIIILVGGNDVCPNLRTGRPPISKKTVGWKFAGLCS